MIYVFSQGSNANGQLGTGNDQDCIIPTLCYQLKANPRSIDGGANHSLLIDANGNLFATGLNDVVQLGIMNNNSSVHKFNRVIIGQIDKELEFTKVACGWAHSLALTNHGQVVSFGDNSFGQLGSEESRTILEIPETMKEIACGLNFCIALDVHGNIWGWGLNRFGELGPKNNTDARKECIRKPKIIVKDYNATQIACGQHHLLFSTVNNEVYTMGSNKFGQLGQCLDINMSNQPIPVKDIQGIPIQIFAGWSFSGFVTSENELYLWGRSDQGQLGFQNVEKQNYKPTKSILRDVYKVVPGSEHCLCLSSQGVFSWGWNEHGNCGVGHTKDIYNPEFLNIEGVCEIASGYGHSFLVQDI